MARSAFFYSLQHTPPLWFMDKQHSRKQQCQRSPKSPPSNAAPMPQGGGGKQVHHDSLDLEDRLKLAPLLKTRTPLN